MVNSDYKIGFIGVGRMGSNMARHLHDEGFSVVAVYDSNPNQAKSLADEIGATEAVQLSQVSHLADYIITVVTDDKAMREIFSESADDSLVKNAEGDTVKKLKKYLPTV